MAHLGLADELFLIGHDGYSGKARIHTNMFSCGLAAAALGELLLAGDLGIEEGRITGWRPRPTGGDVVVDQVLAELQRIGAGHPVHGWIEHLRNEIKEVIAYRLVGRGVVRREVSRSLTGRTSVRYPAVDATEVTRPIVRLGFLLGRRDPLDPLSALLSGLTAAIGVGIVVPMLSAGAARERLAAVSAAMPQAHRDLLKGLDAALAAVALSAHRG